MLYDALSCSVVPVFPFAATTGGISGWTPLESVFLRVDSNTAGFPESPCDTTLRTGRHTAYPYGVLV